MVEVKKKCEEFLLTKTGNMELLVLAQMYNLGGLLSKCIDNLRSQSLTDLQQDPHLEKIETQNFSQILQLKIKDLEKAVELGQQSTSERERRLYDVINKIAASIRNPNYCRECRDSQKVCVC